MKIELEGETLEMLPERALWWPAQRTLFVADIHLGKAASFRRLGQPVPAGTTQANLERLSALIERHAPRRLVFLGDLLHAAPALVPSQIEPVLRWRLQHAALDCVLVRGNHDRRAGDPPPALAITLVDEPWRLDGGRLAACHHPQAVAGLTVLAGHWHPAVRLRGPAHDRQRLPCFCRRPGLLVLPAFGAFTGNSLAPLPADAVCYPVGGGRVWPAMPSA